MARAADGEHAEGGNVFDVRWLCVMFSVMGPGVCRVGGTMPCRIGGTMPCQVGGAGVCRIGGTMPCRVGGTMCVTSTVI